MKDRIETLPGDITLAASIYGKEKDYWLNKLSGGPVKSIFPYDHAKLYLEWEEKPKDEEFEIEKIRFNSELQAKLMKLCKQSDYTLHMLLTAGLTALLENYAHSSDIIIGIPIYKQDMEGEFLNTTLVLRNQFADHITFKELLLQVRQAIVEANENQNYPIETLLYHLNMKFIGTDFPLFEIVILLENIHDKKYIMHTHPNIIFSFLREEGIVEGKLEYNPRLYHRETIERIVNHYIRLLDEAVSNVNGIISKIEIMSEAEKKKILVEFNGTAIDYPAHKTIDELFVEQVKKSPWKLAVANHEESLTYEMLDDHSDQFAYYLCRKGVNTEDVVGIMTENSPRMIIVVLGILKAGGVYMPLNPDYPGERKKFLLKDGNAGLLVMLVINDQLPSFAQSLEVEIIDLRNPGIYEIHQGLELEGFQKNHSHRSPAYIIYTSGSAGKPKGVIVEHRSVVRLVKNTNFIDLREEDRLLQTGALDFDASTFEIWGSLLNGLTLYLADKETILNPTQLEEIVQSYDINTMWLTAPLFNRMMEENIGIFSGLRNLIVGGDVLSPVHINRLRNTYRDLKLINGYGPTENTTFSLTHPIECEYKKNIPIGRPIANSTAYILDKSVRPVPIGVAGELYVGGDGLARGYLNNPELTSEKFIFNRSYRSYRTYILYKTGDLARWLPDGNIEFLGRIDYQVKIRGYRIEPGEIESRLLTLGFISEVAVTVRENNGEKYLCAYVVAKESEKEQIDMVDLRNILSANFPDYMIPSHFVQLEKIPLTANGKCDRKALPEPKIETGSNYIAPRDETEKNLAGIWTDVLEINREHIGIDDDFFLLGGHSLKATTLVSRLHKGFNIKVPLAKIFKYPTIRELARYINTEELAVERFDSIKIAEKKEYYPAAPAQKRMYILQQMSKNQISYNVPVAVILEGNLHKEKIIEISRKLIKRHESLRTSFHLLENYLVQKLHDAESIEFAAQWFAENSGKEIFKNFVRPFDLSTAPLVRVGIGKLEGKKYILAVDMHHIITDGTSMRIFVKEFMDYYAERELPALKLQYKDYSEWQLAEQHKEILVKQEKYWLDRFQGEIAILNLPTDYTRPLVKSFVGNTFNFQISPEHNKSLNDLSAKMGVTLYMLLLAIYNILLAKLSGQEEIVIGTPTAGRRHADLKKIIGMFINTLTMRNFPIGEKRFNEFLKEVKNTTLDAFENQDYQLEDLVEKLEIKRDAARNPLFDAVFSFHNETEYGKYWEESEETSDFKPEVVEFETGISKFDITLNGLELDGRLLLSFEYSTELFSGETIQRFAVNFERALVFVLAAPTCEIGGIEIIPEEEKKQLLYDFNDTKTDYPIDKTIPQLFEEQVEKTPDHMALVGADLRVCPVGPAQSFSLSYRELNNQANGLAQSLTEQGIIPGDIVAIKLERSIEMIIAILGILKSGAAYMPLNPRQPETRTQFMLKDSGAKLLLNDLPPAARNPFEKGFLDFPKLLVNLAYLIYTSGSTGNPKGVPITHDNFSPLIHWGYNLGINEKDRVIQNLSYYFDWSVWEIFIALTTGASLHMITDAVLLNPEAEVEFILKNAITVLHITPTQYGYLLNTGKKLSTLKYLFIGAEKLTVDLAERSIASVNDNCRIFNMYGPTEATIISATLEIDKTQYITYKELTSVPIGSPAAGLLLLVLNKTLNLCPIQIVGELYIAGAGIAKGYLNNPELTAERFKRFNRSYWSYRTYIFYKTGDLARWLADGSIEFLGRMDSQVKIRGYRIEMGEIENRLLKNPSIREAAVVVKEINPEAKYLCAYVVSEKTLLIKDLREYLAQELPDYMVPSFFVQIEKIPLMPNGKIDKGALPEPELEILNNVGPLDEVEEKLAEIWSELLGIKKEQIGINTNFFEVGGHSLKAALLVAKIHKEFNVKVPLVEIFKSSGFRELARHIKRCVTEIYQSLEPVEKREYYPLSSAQKRLFFLQQMDPGGTSYNIPAFWEIKGVINEERLEQSFNSLVQRHESLRTSFEIIGSEAVQRIKRFCGAFFKMGRRPNPLCTAPGLSFFEDSISNSIMESFIRPFDLSQAPLMRVELMKLKEEKHLLMVDMHHIISDGMSVAILTRDFTALYSGKELPGLRIQYKDYVQWQHRENTGEIYLRQNEYWKKEFEGEMPILDFPTDYIRPSVQSYEGRSVDFEIDIETTGKLKSLALASGVTLYQELLALYNIFLAKISGREDIVIGTPVAGRRYVDLEKIIGMFVNTLALRNYPMGEKKFSDFLLEVKEITLKGLENQDYPYEDILEEIGIIRDTSRNPLFDVAFTLHNIDAEEIAIPGLKLLPYKYKNKHSKFDLTLSGIETENKLSFTFEYSTKIFKVETIERFIIYFKNIINVVNENKGLLISEIEIIAEEEKNQILYDFNSTFAQYPDHKTIHQLFAEQVEKTPDHIALVGAEEGEEKKRRRNEETNGGVETLRATSPQIQMSYLQLNEQSDRLAGLLMEKGVLPDNIVGIMLERSVEMIIGILGILKAGGAYLPIDPSFPQERIDFMLKDSGARLLAIANDQEGEKVRRWEGEKVLNSSSLAYIIYTSGSTGKPKGVMVEYRNVIRVVKNTNYINLTSLDRILQLSNYAFDGSVFDIFGALLNGAALVMISRQDVLAIDRVSGIIEREGITVFFITTALFNTLVDLKIECFSHIRNVLFGGERVSVEHSKKMLDYMGKGRIIHVYGPTETTVYAAYYIIDAVDDNDVTIPIGRPISNTTIYILDKKLKMVPIGVSGEICIGGAGVARGYLNNPELTADKFRLNRSYRSYRSYRTDIFYSTGDLARWLPDGNIQFLGRIDHQIKIRGFRVELGEIENRLLKYPGIKEAVVSVLEEEGIDKYLCAYIVSESKYDEIDAPGIREFLAKEFPDYMIPSYFMQLEKIPLTLNGKLDRNAFPKPELTLGQNYVAPRNKLEVKLVGLWAELLNIQPGAISIDKNFFELGGHSLKASILVSKIHKELNIILPLAVLFKTSTIRGLSAYIMDRVGDTFESIMPVEEKEYYSLSFAQKRLYVLQQMDVSSVSYNIPAAFILEGEPVPWTLENTFREIIKRHESLRTSFIMVNDEPVQRVHKNVEFEIEYKNCNCNCKSSTDYTDFIRAFDLTKAPLLRVGLLKVAEHDYLLMLDMHHIIADGTSMGVFAKEFMALYSGTELPGLKIHYKDFASWQNGFRETEKMKKQETYWLSQFEGGIPTLNLLTDFQRPVVQSFKGSPFTFVIGEGGKLALRALAIKEGVTLYMLLLAVFNVLFSRLGSQEDIIVGTTTAGRRHADLQHLIGMFVNTLALRNFPSANKTFEEFLGEVKQRTLAAFENQDYPFENLVEKVEVNRDPGRNPLFDLMFVLQNLENVEIEIPGLLLKPYEYRSKIAKFDLTLTAVENGNKVVFTFEYCTSLFKEETMKRLSQYFKKLLLSVIKKPGRKIFEIEIIPGEERRQILYDFNKTEYEYPASKTLHGLFEEAVEKIPGYIAVFGQSRTTQSRTTFMNMFITYEELNERSGRLAGLLIKKGILIGDIVAVMLERSVEMIIGILGILKAGGVYLPIDPGYPELRKQYMLKDSNAFVLINEKFFGGLRGAVLQKSLPINANLAYIIYTSGSTGRPKGVLVRHEGFVNLIYYHRKIFGEGPGIRMSQVSNPGFDAMALEVWPCLTSGASMYIADEKTRLDPAMMKQWLIEKEIASSFQSTLMAEQLLAEVWSEEGVALKVLRTGGDKLTRYPARKYPFKLYNLYGPTEDTVVTTWAEISIKTNADGLPTIGKPIANHRVYVMGANLEILPVLVPGELCIGGIGLAVGYLNRQELTADKFIFNRSYRSYRTYILYRTGDQVRWLIDGNIEFLGRIDGQVKLRGFRIELGEIESRLADYDGIKEAVIVLREKNHQPYLCAYFVAVREVATPELREYLAGSLPAYMIPSYFVPMDRIPLTPNGKVDRQGLPEPMIKTGESYGAPGGFVEEKLVEVWQEVLGVEGIGIYDNFFEVGGDSIKGVQIVSRLQKYGLKIEVADIFLHPTIRGAAASIKKIERIADQGTVTGVVELTPIQQWFFKNNFTYSNHFNQAVMVYREAGFDEAIVRRVFQKIVEHHDALRMVYEKKNLKIVQRNRGLEENLFGLEVINFQNEANVELKIENEAERLQVSINLEKGPLVRLGLFRTGKGDHLLIAVHHLVIDGVSWRILLEDFTNGYRQTIEKGPVKFQAKTDSFKEWARGLTGYAGNEFLLKELDYWKRVETGDPLPKDIEITNVEKKVKNFETIELKLSEEETSQLLRRVHRAYGTEINDILLAGLVSALLELWGIQKVLINLEGHGREELPLNIDISRTVGWFTCQYPVLLKVSRPGDLDYLVKEVKETLRRVPCRGIGYGILKYLTSVERKGDFPAAPEVEIDFNYLGEFGSSLNNDIFQVSELNTGHAVSLETEKKTVLDISGLMKGGQLILFVSYNRYQYCRETMEGLAEAFRSNLAAIIGHCAARDIKTLTPSDLTYSDFTIDELDALVDRWGELEDIYELAPMQAGMLFHALKGNIAGTYFQQTVFSLQGNIDCVLLQSAFRQLIDRYDVLRTVFYYENVQQPVQMVLKQYPLEIDFQDLQGTGVDDMEWYLQEYYRKDRERGFDLIRGPLTRLTLLKIDGNSYRLVWSFHHILMDGWCLGIIFKDLLNIYFCLKKGVPSVLAPVFPYRNYIKWLRGQDIGAGVGYWQNYLDGYEPQVGLGNRLETHPGKAYRLKEYTVCPDDVLWGRLKSLSVDWRVTINTVMQTAWGVLLQRYNNKDDVVFGAVTSGRPPGIEGIEGMVGLFINTLPVRIKTVERESFAHLLRGVQVDAVSSRTYEYISLADIQANSMLKEALIDHIMAFENYPLGQEIKNSLNPKEYGFIVDGLQAFEQTNYDFNISISPLKSLAIKFSYNAAVYDREFIERTGAYLINILFQVVEKPGLKTGEIEILTNEEKRRILYDFNDTASPYPAEKTVHQLFKEQAVKSPDHIALVGAAEEREEKKRRREEEKKRGVETLRATSLQYQYQITYRQLNEQSDLFAGALIDKGVLADSIVGIMAYRSIEMVIDILGILKAGGAYLPIDPGYPQERINYILRDSAAKMLAGANELEGKKVRRWEGEKVLNSSNLAYIIYTSGTTGWPKGIMIEHKSLVNFIFSMYKDYREDFGTSDRCLSLTNFCFDVSVCELFMPLVFGAAIVLPGYDKILDPWVMAEIIIKKAITFTYIPPGLLREVYEYLKIGLQVSGGILGMNKMLVGVEPIKDYVLADYLKLNPSMQIINGYGPTEATICAAAYRYGSHGPGGKRVPIGHPLANMVVLLLDKYRHLVPIELAGELYAGGAGVARGYLNNPELTNQKFLEVQEPFFKKVPGLFYKTGDLARWLIDGNIEFLGRMDTQVKIRGFRVETGEIENIILKHEDVRAAVVLAKDEGYLCAYFTSERELPASLLREYTAAYLPDYMVPSYFTQIEQLPLTSSGKVDRKALPEPGLIKGREYMAPTGKIEEKLADIWADVLGISRETIDAGTNFFHLGGHSLRATVLMSKIHKYLNIRIPLEEIFKNPTIRGLAAYISSAEEDKFAPIPLVEEKEYYVLSASQNRFYMFQQLERESTIYNIPEVVLLQGKLDRKKLEKIFLELVARHESFRTSFIITGGEVVQQIHRDMDFEIEYYDLATKEKGKNNHQSSFIIHDFIRPFDLSRAPLLRVGLIKEKEDEHILLVDTHHIISDGVSQTLLMKEFMDFYWGQEATMINALRPRYKDYAEWQNTADMQKIMKAQEAYWLKEFAGNIPISNLPTDFARPDVMHFEGSMMDFEIETVETLALKCLAEDESVSVFGLILTILNIFISKITRREDICIGTQIAGRRHPDLQGIIGVFLNSLALRNFPKKENTFKTFLHQVMKRTLQAFENQEYQFESLVEKVLGKREVNRNPLFDVMLVWQNFEHQEIKIPNLTLKPYPHEHKSRALTDLELYGWEIDGKFSFTFEYSTELFEKETVKRFINYFKEIISTVIANKDIKLKDIRISHDLGKANPGLFHDNDDGFGF